MSDAADDSGRCHEGKWAVSGDASVSTSKDGPRSGTLVLLFDDDDDDDRLAEAISCLSRFGHPWRRDRDLRALGVPVDNVESSVSTSKPLSSRPSCTTSVNTAWLSMASHGRASG
eukprot:CAMPEP_0175870606 /NCGR_PEP_ID=MMETSP0107_2-20121207/36656_1 /TAXON_ID=195067 ORGANISM="Goniomonas pacifica, Strain CCMP1869" /NCGR_SAMPLE_ID=MMETSP0107_2 /ASSEMBLY_ACC=CAM_ASM_000203 /LENGTH=114 /DNA_ID=CAMNT_0017188859 /DNA_START=204 /DNA_END=548 /DNA_ORIENTATION=+